MVRLARYLPVVLNIGLQADVAEIAIPVSLPVHRAGEQRWRAGEKSNQAGKGVIPVPIRVAVGVDLMPPDVHSKLDVVASFGPEQIVFFGKFVLQEPERVGEIRTQRVSPVTEMVTSWRPGKACRMPPGAL